MIDWRFLGSALALALTACGGGGGSSSAPPTSGGTPTPTPAPTPTPTVACAGSTSTNTAYACTLTSPSLANASWTISGAPVGMIAQKSGALRWTPLDNQTGSYKVTATGTAPTGTISFDFTVVVAAGASAPQGIYVSPNGSDTAAGTAAAPFKTVQRAFDAVAAGDTIYLRGGVYQNSEFGQPRSSRTEPNLAQTRTSGTAANPIMLRPHGNEYPKLQSDVVAIRLRDANYWTIQGLEIEGNSQSLDFNTTMDNWWVEEGFLLAGRGISTAGTDHLTIRDNVIHDFPAAAIAVNGAEFLNIEDNIAYNSAWWSTGGVHGITSSSMFSSSAANENLSTVKITGNFAFSNQSIIISHVFSKGFVTMDVDEGNNFHLQNNNDGTFKNRVLFENNLALYGGKSGLGLNTIDNVEIRNNGFFRNARVVNTGSLSIQSSRTLPIIDNLFAPRPDRFTIRTFGTAAPDVRRNATTGANGDSAFGALQTYSQVFANPMAFDFSPASGVPSGLGIAPAKLTQITNRMAEYGVRVTEPTQVVDDAYIDRMIRIIISKWPVAFDNIVLRIRGGNEYTYAQRCSYPGTPAVVPCS